MAVICEIHLLKFLMEYDIDPEHARAQITDECGTFSDAKINPVKDVHKDLWKFVSLASKSKKLRKK